MNKVILIGNLTGDPEASKVHGDISLSKFRIAVQRRFANAQGVREADFFTVIAWRQTADFCNRYLSKGRKVAIEGSIQIRSYDAQDGSKRYVTEIIADSVEAVGGREEAAHGNRGTPAQPVRNEQQRMDYMEGQFTEVDPGDELPF